MKYLTLYCTVSLLLCFSVANGQGKYTYPDTTLKSLDPIKAEKAKALALDYLRIFAKGDNIDSLVKICSVPFSWDRKRIIDNWVDFKASQQSLIDEKGKDRQFKVDSVFIKAIRSEILDRVIPINVYYVVVKIKYTWEGRERSSGVLFAVQISDEPRIIGIKD